MSQDIFKLYHLEYNNINKIEVFNGINSASASASTSANDEIFDTEELEEVTDKGVFNTL